MTPVDPASVKSLAFTRAGWIHASRLSLNMMSQALCRGELPLVANAQAGQVEHEAFERANAGASAARRTSDHRPVSLRLEAR